MQWAGHSQHNQPSVTQVSSMLHMILLLMGSEKELLTSVSAHLHFLDSYRYVRAIDGNCEKCFLQKPLMQMPQSVQRNHRWEI